MADHLIAGLHCADLTDAAPAFVLGALEPAEAAAVREHLAACPEAHAEFAELGSVVPMLLESVERLEPPVALRDRILAAAAAESQRPAQTAPPPMLAARPEPAPPRPIDAPRRVPPAQLLVRRPLWGAIGLAAALAIVAMGAWNLSLRSQVDDLTAYRNGVVAVLDQASRPGAQLAFLAAPAGGTGPSGLAAVDASGSIALVMRDLAPTTGGQVYEAWLIGADGVPVPVGGFQVATSGSAAFTAPAATAAPGVTVALTLEPGPGATTPTLPIIAVGKASAETS